MALPQSVKEKVFFSTFVQTFFIKAHAGRVTPRLKERLFQVGLDLDHLEATYRADHLPVWLVVCAEELHPGLPLEQAQEALGARWTEGWKESLIGRAVIAICRFIPARAALGRVPSNFRGLDNFTRVTLEDVGPTELTMTFEDVLGVPHFYLGMMRAGETISSARNPKTELLPGEGPGATFRCTWDG